MICDIAGYYFLRETRALPRMDTVVNSAWNSADLLSSLLRRFYVITSTCDMNSIEFEPYYFQGPFLRSRNQVGYDIGNEDLYEDVYEKNVRSKYPRRRKRFLFSYFSDSVTLAVDSGAWSSCDKIT